MATTLLMASGCSLNDTLDSNEDLSVSLIETLLPIQAEPGDTIVFRFVASTPKGNLERVQLTSEDGLTPVIEKVSFAMLENETTLNLDKNGYFSREISTVMVEYPIVVPNDENLRGKTLSLDLSVARNDGQRKNVHQIVDIIRYIHNPVGIDWTGTKDTLWLYNPITDKVFTTTEYTTQKSEINLIFHKDKDGRFHVVNPASEWADTLMWGAGAVDYNHLEMNNTEIGISNLKTRWLQITEKELASMELSSAVTRKTNLTTSNSSSYTIYGFILSDGRKGSFIYRASHLISKLQLK